MCFFLFKLNIQNSGNIAPLVSILLNDQSIFNDTVFPSLIMPPLVKDITVENLSYYTQITVKIEKNNYIKNLSDSVIDIIVDVTSKDPINLYYQRVSLK
jgi:hypothetical protein